MEDPPDLSMTCMDFAKTNTLLDQEVFDTTPLHSSPRVSLVYEGPRRRNSMEDPPDLRMMLVGPNWVKTNKVGNTLLDKEVFETEDQSSLMKSHSTAINKYVHNKYTTVASMADLFSLDLSDYTLRQRVKKCMSLCHPGPHALVLVVDPRDFGEQQRERMEQIMDLFSERAQKHVIVFISSGDMTAEADREIERIVQSCGGRRHIYSRNQTEALKAVEEIASKNDYSLLTYEGFEDADSSSRSSLGAVSSGKLNLALCGSDTSLKSSVADVILGFDEQTGQGQQLGASAMVSAACMKREAHVCGHHVTLILLPSLESCQASEKDLWKETLECLRLCEPGVDAFLLITPQGQLTDEDKSALKRLGHFFGEEVRAFCLTVITQHFEHIAEAGHGVTVSRQGTGTAEGPCFIMDHASKVKPLLERVMKMREDNRGWYTHDMYSAAQLKSHMRCHSQLQEMKITVSRLQHEIKELKCTEQGLQEDADNLRIVLVGKAGEGKSATGNTILGKCVFKEDFSFQSVTTICQKETAIVNGRRITVIDTPDLSDLKKEIVKCIGMAAPGPHVFLLVKEIGRFTQEERHAVQMIQKMFGDQSGMYTLVLFTHGDKLKGKPLDLQNVGHDMMRLLRSCEMRHHVLDNSDKNNRSQVNELLRKIDKLVGMNGGTYYTNEMFQEVEEALQQEQERILLEKKEEIEKEKQELQAKHQAEMEKLKNDMEEEKKTQEEEIKRREDGFGIKENNMAEAMKKMEQEDIRKAKEMKEEYQRKRQENEEWIKEQTKEIHLKKEKWEGKARDEQKRREEDEDKRKLREVQEENNRQEMFHYEREQFNQRMLDLLKVFEEDMRKKQDDRVKKMKEKQKELEEKIKHSEESKVKELEEHKRMHEEECQRNWDEEEKRRKEEERKWKGKQERYKKEKQEEKKKDAEEKQRKIQEEQERRKMCPEAETKIREKEDEIRELQEQYELKLQEEKEKREREEEELRIMKEEFEKYKEAEFKAREEEDKQNIECLRKAHEKETFDLNRETQKTARMKAEDEFNKELEKQVKQENEPGVPQVESRQTGFCKSVNDLISLWSKK